MLLVYIPFSYVSMVNFDVFCNFFFILVTNMRVFSFFLAQSFALARRETQPSLSDLTQHAKHSIHFPRRHKKGSNLLSQATSMANQLFRRVFQYNLIGQKLMGLHRVALNLGQKVLTRFHPQFPFIEGQGGYGWNVILQYGAIIK